MRVLFVHGACVRDGAWWWHRMTEPLAERGHTTSAVEIPSCTPELGDLHADGDAVRAALDASGEPAILCGHSYGGHVITDAADHPLVRGLVRIATVRPEGPPPPWLTVADGTMAARPDLPPDLLFHDCPDVVPEAMARMAPQSLAAHAQQPRARVEVPTTYVVCAEDRWTPPETQRAQATGRIVELPTGHHPFLSRPGILAGVF